MLFDPQQVKNLDSLDVSKIIPVKVINRESPEFIQLYRLSNNHDPLIIKLKITKVINQGFMRRPGPGRLQKKELYSHYLHDFGHDNNEIDTLLQLENLIRDEFKNLTLPHTSYKFKPLLRQIGSNFIGKIKVRLPEFETNKLWKRSQLTKFAIFNQSINMCTLNQFQDLVKPNADYFEFVRPYVWVNHQIQSYGISLRADTIVINDPQTIISQIPPGYTVPIDYEECDSETETVKSVDSIIEPKSPTFFEQWVQVPETRDPVSETIDPVSDEESSICNLISNLNLNYIK